MGADGSAKLSTVKIRIRRRDERRSIEVLLQFCLSGHRSYRSITKDLGICDALNRRRDPITKLCQPAEVQVLVQRIIEKVHFLSDYQAESQAQGFSCSHSTPCPQRLDNVLQQIESEVCMDRKASKSPHVPGGKLSCPNQMPRNLLSCRQPTQVP
jgi:hypothetical protein